MTTSGKGNQPPRWSHSSTGRTREGWNWEKCGYHAHLIGLTAEQFWFSVKRPGRAADKPPRCARPPAARSVTGYRRRPNGRLTKSTYISAGRSGPTFHNPGRRRPQPLPAPLPPRGGHLVQPDRRGVGHPTGGERVDPHPPAAADGRRADDPQQLPHHPGVEPAGTGADDAGPPPGGAADADGRDARRPVGRRPIPHPGRADRGVRRVRPDAACAAASQPTAGPHRRLVCVRQRRRCPRRPERVHPPGGAGHHPALLAGL